MNKPPPPEAPIEPLTPPAVFYLVGGLAAYALGFFLLSRDHPDLAPVVIVGGIVSMCWAFLK